MTTTVIRDLETRSDTAWKNLSAQLTGMTPFLERADEPGEWTTRQVLTHLMFPPGWDVVAVLKSFSHGDLPVIEIDAGDPALTPERRTMTLDQLVAAIEEQRQNAFAYLRSLSEADLTRKARIPLFKTFMGTDEIPLPEFVDAIYEYHLNDHAEQLAKIRDAVGLPAVK